MPMRTALSGADIDRLYEEDAAYGDLTTRVLGIGALAARMTFSARYDMQVCGTEEAGEILAGGDLPVELYCPSGTAVTSGTLLLSVQGTAAELFEIWKIVQTLIEWQSGIATATAAIVRAARAVAPQIVVACTRKNVPLTRRLSTRAVVAGGGTPHRLSLSDSILLFPEHLRFLDGNLAEAIARLRCAAPERTIVVEVCGENEAIRAAAAGPDVLQLEKLPPASVRAIRSRLASDATRVLIAAAGGINASNAASYAEAGADILVTSNPYYAPPCDVAVKLEPLHASG